MELSRRTFLKSGVAAATAMAVGIPVSRIASAAAETEQDWRWDKGVCCFCGVGCGIMIATQDGKVVAAKGDPDAPVNRGLNCVKGYFNGKILYGKDRLTQPLMRMTDGRFDKKGKFTPVTWDRVFDEMTSQFKKAYEEEGPTGIGVIGSGQWLIQEGYAMTKLMKAGFRSNNIDPNGHNCMASAVAAFVQVFGIDEPPGNYDDIEYTDTAVAWGTNIAEAHRVLWQRVIRRRALYPGFRPRTGQGRLRRILGCLQGKAGQAGGSLRRSESQDGRFLDHGLQSTCAPVPHGGHPVTWIYAASLVQALARRYAAARRTEYAFADVRRALVHDLADVGFAVDCGDPGHGTRKPLIAAVMGLAA